jgi:hypothetical protein
MVFVLLKIDWFEQSFWLKNKDLIDEYIAKLKSGTNVSIKDIVSNNTWSDCFIVIIYYVPFNILNCLRLIRRKIGRPAAVWIVPYRSQSVILTLLFCVASNLTRTQLGAHQLCGYYRTLWPGKRARSCPNYVLLHSCNHTPPEAGRFSKCNLTIIAEIIFPFSDFIYPSRLLEILPRC